MIIRIELTESDLDTIVRVLSDAADYAGDIVNASDEEDEEHDLYRDEHFECKRLAGYLETCGLLAASKDFSARMQGPSVN